MGRYPRFVVFLLTIVALQSLVIIIIAVALVLPLVMPASADDIQIVKNMPVPRNSSYTVENLLSAAVLQPINRLLDIEPEISWRQFHADRGVTVIEVNGVIENRKIQELLVKELESSIAIPLEEVDDFSFNIQFTRHYTTPPENKLTAFSSRILPKNLASNYHYEVAFQTFGALKDNEYQYYDVLSTLAHLLKEAY